jgi:TIR domain
MFLFVCHASEDRDDFVRPLAEALRKEYEKVWYSEYELTLGDSLLEKIDQGLASCDFGIVVLSKPFLRRSGRVLSSMGYSRAKRGHTK